MEDLARLVDHLPLFLVVAAFVDRGIVRKEIERDGVREDFRRDGTEFHQGVASGESRADGGGDIGVHGEIVGGRAAHRERAGVDGITVGFKGEAVGRSC